jgi:hypothetical protein
VQEYLRIYSEDNDAFQGFERDYRVATKTLYTWYCKVHKEHSIVFKSLPKSVQPLVFDLHKFYLSNLRPANKSLHMAEAIEWIGDYLKSQYGVPNMIRFSKETEQPTRSTYNPREVTNEGDTLRVTLNIDDCVNTGAVAPSSPLTDTAEVVENV